MKDWSDTCSRRGEVSEPWLAAALSVLNAVQRSRACKGAGPHPARTALLRARQAAEASQLAAHIAYDDGVRKAEEQSGRISGSLLWRAARRELGDPTAKAAATAAGAASAAGGAGKASNTASIDADSGWLHGEGFVVDGWALAQTAPASSAAAAAAAPPATAPAPLVTPSPLLSVRSLTSFGALLVALRVATSPDGRKGSQLVWRPAPPAPLAAAAAAAAAAAHSPAIPASAPVWKPMHVWALPSAGSAGATSSDSAGSLSPWPAPGTAVVAVAAEPGTMRCYAIVNSLADAHDSAGSGAGAGARTGGHTDGLSLSVWHIEHEAVPATVAAAAPPVVDAASTPAGLTPPVSAPHAGAKAWLARRIYGSDLQLPEATRSVHAAGGPVGEPPGVTEGAHTCPAPPPYPLPSAAVAAGRLWLLAGGKLWRSTALNVTSSVASAGAAGDVSEPFWAAVAPAARCSDLCATAGANPVLLALQADADAPVPAPAEVAGGGSAPPPVSVDGAAGSSGSIVVLTRMPSNSGAATAAAAADESSKRQTATVPLLLRNTDGGSFSESSGAGSATSEFHIHVPLSFLDGSATAASLAAAKSNLSSSSSALQLTLTAGSQNATGAAIAPSGGAGAASAVSASAAIGVRGLQGLQPGDWVTLAPVGQASQPSWQRSASLWECAAFAADAPAGRPDEGAGARPSAVHGTWLPRVVTPEGKHLLGASALGTELVVPLQATVPPATAGAIGAAAAAAATVDASATEGAELDAPFWRQCRLQLPAQPGAYELRVYRGPGYGRCIGVSAGPVLLLRQDEPTRSVHEGGRNSTAPVASTDARGGASVGVAAGAGAGAGTADTQLRPTAAGASAAVWVPLLPAAHVAGLAVLGKLEDATGHAPAAATPAAAAGAGAGAVAPQLCAITSNGDVWTCRLPQQLLRGASRTTGSASAVSRPGQLSVFLTDWALPTASAPADAADAAGAASVAAQAATLVSITSTVAAAVAGSFTSSVGAGISGAGAGPATVAPVVTSLLSHLPPPARIQALFAQLTKGCSPGSGSGSGSGSASGSRCCTHPHCASNPAVGPQAAKAAVLRAAQLANADGAFCPAFAAAFKAPGSSGTGAGAAGGAGAGTS